MSVVASLMVALGLKTAHFTKGANNARRDTKNLKSELLSLNKSVASVGAAFSKLGPILAGLGVAVGTKQLMNAADSFTDLNSRLAATTKSGAETTETMRRLSEVAARTYSSISQTTEGFLANQTVLKDLGLSTAQALDYTEALNNAMVVSGAKGDAAASVQKALSDALILGKLSGDGLNSVMTKGGVLAELLAKELGTTVTGLKDFGTKGKITSDVIVNTLFKNFKDLREQADNMPATFGDAAVQVGNAVTTIAGRFNEVTEASSNFTGSIKGITDAITEFAYSDTFESMALNITSMFDGISSKVSEVLAPVFRDVKILITDLMNGMSPLNEMFSGLGNIWSGLGAIAVPVFSMIWETLKTGLSIVVELGSLFISVFSAILGPIGNADNAIGENGFIGTLRAVSETVTTVMQTVREKFEMMGAYARGAVEAFKAAFDSLPAALGSAMYTAANAVIGAVEYMINSVIGMINSAVQAAARAAAVISSTAATISFGQVGSHTSAAMMNGPQQPTVAPVNLKLDNPYEGAGAAMGKAAGDAFTAEVTKAEDKIKDRTVGRLLSNLPPLSGLNNDILGQNSDEVAIPTLNLPGGAGGGGGGGKGKGGGSGGKGGKEKVSEYKKVYDDLTKTIDQLRATMGMTAEQEEVWTAQRDAGVLGNAKGMAAIEQQVKLKQSLEAQSEALKENANFWKDFAKTAVDGLASVFSGASSLKDLLKDLGAMIIKMGLTKMLTGLFPSLNVGANANGTPSWRGGLTWVGERGPELINLNRGAAVYDHARSNRIASNMNGQGAKPQLFYVDQGVISRTIDEAEARSMKNTKSAIKDYDKNVAPKSMQRISADRRAVGY